MKRKHAILALAFLVILLLPLGNCNGTAPQKTKILNIYDNQAVLSDKTIDAVTTLNYVESYHGNSYSYLTCSGGINFSQEYNETTDKWPLLEGLLIEAQKRNIDIWVTFHNPIHYQNGDFGELGKKMLFKEWFTSLARLSKQYSNLKGVMVDDFGESGYWTIGNWKDANGERVYTPEYLQKMQSTINAENPNFKFYVILYWPNMMHTYWDPRAPYIDGLVFPDFGHGRPMWKQNISSMDSQISSLKNGYLSEEQDLLICVYVVKHGWWQEGANDENYIEQVTRRGLEQTDGIYEYTLDRDYRIFNETFCDNIAEIEEQVTKNACIVKKIFCEYNPNCNLELACGNGLCDAGETIETCPADCSVEICDGKDNDGDGQIDEDNVCCGNQQCETGETVATCPQDCQECIDNEKLVGQYIPQWKRGEISMLALMQKIKQRNTGEECPPE